MHTEAVLLVDNRDTEIGKLDRALEQGMRADGKVVSKTIVK